MDMHKSSGYYLISDGIITLLAGALLFFFTGISQGTLVYLFAAYAMVYGISQLVAARGELEPEQNPAAFWAIGGFSILAGVLFLLFVSASLNIVIGYIAIYAILMGVAEASIAYGYRELHGYSWLAATGILQALFGLVLFAYTGITLATFIAVVAAYAVVVGALTFAYGYVLSQSSHAPHATQPR